MRLICLTLALLALSGCSTTTVVNNCPVWLEVGTIDVVDDTELTKRWMFRFEKNRQRECKDKETLLHDLKS